MKTLAAATLSLMLASTVAPAFAQTMDTGNNMAMNDTTMTNNGTMHHKKHSTHHRKSHKHGMGNNTSNMSGSSTEELNNTEATNTTK